MISFTSSVVLGAVGFLAQLAAATPPNDTVLAAAALVLPGQHTPLLLSPDDNGQFLSAQGAQQMYGLGQLLRNRYIAGDNSTNAPLTAIHGLSQGSLDPSQLFILVPDSQYESASAQALLQGLYPPASPKNGSSNGSSFPLGGYQYPWIHTAAVNDTERVWLDGVGICADYYNDNGYLSSSQYRDMKKSTDDFYASVAKAVAHPEVSSEVSSYAYAPYVYDAVQQLAATNTTISNALNAVPAALNRLRYLADGLQWNTFGATSNNGFTRIAGQTAAFALLDTLVNNIVSGGEVFKLSTLIAKPEAMISLASLLDLPATQPDFYGQPLPGSALIIELFINEAAAVTDVQNAYTNLEQLNVRLLFRNGTDSTAPLANYIMSNSGAPTMSWMDFTSTVGRFAVGDLSQWCGTCDSWLSAAFCMTYNSTAVAAATNTLDRAKSASSSVLTPAIAGAIGAVATLAALILFIILAVGCCGMRIVSDRQPASTQNAPSAAPAGFRGMRKLASDPDLGAIMGKRPAAGVEVVKDADGSTLGHARVGSWELKDTGATRGGFDEEAHIEGLDRVVHPAERF